MLFQGRNVGVGIRQHCCSSLYKSLELVLSFLLYLPTVFNSLEQSCALASKIWASLTSLWSSCVCCTINSANMQGRTLSRRVFSFQERPDKIWFLLSSHKTQSVYSLKKEQKRLRLKPWLCDKTSFRVKAVPGASASWLARAGVLIAPGLVKSPWKPLAFRGSGLNRVWRKQIPELVSG